MGLDKHIFVVFVIAILLNGKILDNRDHDLAGVHQLELIFVV